MVSITRNPNDKIQNEIIELADLTESIAQGDIDIIYEAPSKIENEDYLPYQSMIDLEQFKDKLDKLLCGEKHLQFTNDIEMIFKHKSNLFTCIGEPGDGKTTIVREIALLNNKQEGKDFIIKTGHISPSRLHKILYQFKEKNCVLVFDDCDEVFQDQKSANMLKSATDNKPNRRINYDVTLKSNCLVPNEFNFFASIIIISNVHLGKRNAALKDRGLYLELFLEPYEKMEYIKEFLVPHNYPNTDLEDRKTICRQLELAVNSGARDFTCRDFERLLMRYKEAPKTLPFAIRELYPKNEKNKIKQFLYVMDKNKGNYQIWKDQFCSLAKVKNRQYYNYRKKVISIIGNDRFESYKLE